MCQLLSVCARVCAPRGLLLLSSAGTVRKSACRLFISRLAEEAQPLLILFPDPTKSQSPSPDLQCPLTRRGGGCVVGSAKKSVLISRRKKFPEWKVYKCNKDKEQIRLVFVWKSTEVIVVEGNSVKVSFGQILLSF